MSLLSGLCSGNVYQAGYEGYHLPEALYAYLKEHHVIINRVVSLFFRNDVQVPLHHVDWRFQFM